MIDVVAEEQSDFDRNLRDALGLDLMELILLMLILMTHQLTH